MKQLYYVIQTLLHGRSSNIIKVISLGLGLTMSILLFSRIAYEQSFDTCFKEPDKLYQLWSEFKMNGNVLDPQQQNVGSLSGGVLEALSEEVEGVTSIGKNWLSAPLYNGNVCFNVKKILADSLFFQTMGIEVLSGNPMRDLAQKDVIYLSKLTAEQMFGGENPIGKIITYDRMIDLTVKGTFADLPKNCTMRTEAVVSMPSLWSREWGNYSWNGGDSWHGYVRLKHDTDIEQLNKRINIMIQQHIPDDGISGYSAYLKPIRDTYRGADEVKRMHNIMLILGIAILFITALNYVLVSISSLSRRAKSIGVHKCNGAGGTTVFGMFLMETAIIIFISLLIMSFLVLNFREFVEDIASTKLGLLFALNRIWVPLIVIGVLFIIGGVLPGRIFSQIPVTQIFHRYTEGKKSWKRPLLFVQFAGVAFIGGLMCVVMLQYHYVINKDPGYNPERIAIGTNYAKEYTEAMAVRHFYEGLPYVEQVTSSMSTPSHGYSGEMIPDKNGKALFSTRYDCVQENYAAVMGMAVKQGRAPRESNEIAVNETFSKLMNWGSNVVGRNIITGEGTIKIVGLLKDFNIESFFAEPMPFVMYSCNTFNSLVHIRLKEPFAENLQKLNQDATQAFPTRTINFYSLEQQVMNGYDSVRIFRNSVLLAAITILFITLMGLIGYTNDEIQRRSKEIAIRKVNGAEASSILELLARDVIWVALPAVLLGTVCAWYVGGIWMEQFAASIGSTIPYHICIGIIVLVLIVGCVIAKAWKIANENPVKSIKSE